ncbi:hypothetical protein CLF_106810 [Clonorchis sinensis]|uniref:Uncharacterized protein n=1 Tax=Clonorchis sinensis TaxID=79923 RepID=G7YFR5_CLOSI|nr:hypothetical protein CLF_106810 [Clonorchis sinensis]
MVLRENWYENRIPAEWSFSTVIQVSKKGARILGENHRGISLVAVISKLIGKSGERINGFLISATCSPRWAACVSGWTSCILFKPGGIKPEDVLQGGATAKHEAHLLAEEDAGKWADDQEDEGEDDEDADD